MTDGTVYPITAEFERYAKDIVKEYVEAKHFTVAKDLSDMRWILRNMQSTLGEYEHGTADIEDVFRGVIGFDLSEIDDGRERRRMCLELYSAVLRDMALVLLVSE